MSTVYDVAARAGLSVGTVSRYLTGNGYVSAAARERIAAAITEIGYIQDRAAASLTTKKTGLLGFVVSQLRNPYTVEVASAMGDAARVHGYGVVLADSCGDPALAISAVELLRGHKVDGLIVTPPESPAYNDTLIAAAREIPVVGIGLRTTPMVTDLATVDTRLGARQAVQYLIGLGHRRIAYFGSDSMALGRLAAYREILAEHGITADPALTQLGGVDRPAGYAAAQRVLALADPPTAIFAANDTVAFGAIQAAASLGIRVPDDLSVIGFDDIDLASFAIPPLTTVAQRMSQLGEAAITLLMNRLNGVAPDGEPQEVVLDSHLVIRDSCAPPPDRRQLSKGQQ